MKEKIKKILSKNKAIYKVVHNAAKFLPNLKLYMKTKKQIKNKIKDSKDKIYYFGIPAHPNLGDLAQGVCIREWLKNKYPNRTVIEIETNSVVNTQFSLLKYIKKIFNNDKDFVVFQSGYTTTDLGGYADEMHRAVMKILPDAKMLMLPQTIFFLKEENKKRTSICYDKMSKMLFLARDRISYDMAKEMFPHINVMKYPDIVTTMIGNYSFDNERNGILLCCRDDVERFYSEDEIKYLEENCKKIDKVDMTDTTKYGNENDIVKNAKKHILNEIGQYSKYKAIITDRYHGTIFSLVAGTPVVIIKTKDHKVITGAEWFKGIYDEYVYLADSLEEAVQIVKEIYNKKFDHKLEPYFQKEYYDKLPDIFKNI